MPKLAHKQNVHKQECSWTPSATAPGNNKPTKEDRVYCDRRYLALHIFSLMF